MVFFLNSCVKRDQDSTFTALVPGTNYCIYGRGGGVRRVSFSSSVRGEGHCYLLWCVMLKLSRLSLSMSDKQSRPKTISKESVWYGHFIGDATAELVA